MSNQWMKANGISSKIKRFITADAGLLEADLF